MNLDTLHLKSSKISACGGLKKKQPSFYFEETGLSHPSRPTFKKLVLSRPTLSRPSEIGRGNYDIFLGYLPFRSPPDHEIVQEFGAHYHGITIKNPPLTTRHPKKIWESHRTIKRHPKTFQNLTELLRDTPEILKIGARSAQRKNWTFLAVSKAEML